MTVPECPTPRSPSATAVTAVHNVAGVLLAALLAAVCAVLAALAVAQAARLRGAPSSSRVETLVAEAGGLRARLAAAEALLATERAATARAEQQGTHAGSAASALNAEVAGLRARLAVAEAALVAEREAAAQRLEADRGAASRCLEAERVSAADLLRAEREAAAQRLEAEQAAATRLLAAERAAAADRLDALEKAQLEAESRLSERFSALSSDALERSSTSFLQLAEQHLSRQRADGAAELDARATLVAGLISPVAEVLTQVQERMQRLEVARAEADTAVLTQVEALSQAQRELRSETANLVTALRAPSVRGRWGELQLRRVVEVAGMARHCDFEEQVRAVGPDGIGVRPDLVVRLAGGKSVVVDAKVPLQGFLEASEASDEPTRQRRLADHARQVRNHVDALGAKRYQQAFDPTPDLVVLFVPGDAILSSAAEADGDLFEHAAQKRVLLAGPTTLIGLLHAIAHGWRQEAVAEHARQVCDLGRELHKRLGTLGDHLDRTGRSLDRAVEAYNMTVGSLEGRVLVTARKLADIEIAEGELPTPTTIERSTRPLAAPELLRAVGPAKDVA